MVFLSASISTVSSDWPVGLQGDRSLYSQNAQCAGMVLVLSDYNPCHWGCPHDQKNLPKGFHQSLQDPRCSWRLCRLCNVPAYQTLCGSRLPASICSLNSPLCVSLCSCSSILGTHTEFLQLCMGHTHLGLAAHCWRVTSGPQLILGPTDIHSVGATVSWFGLV